MIKELKNLWHTVFCDDHSIIDEFFRIFYNPELVATEYVDGELAAAAYVMPAGYLIHNNNREKCAHIYAVAVYPEYRGRGFGISVTNKAVELAKAHGYTAVVLHPAEETLFRYYEKHCGFTTAFTSCIYEKNLLSVTSFVKSIDIDTYLHAREKYLADTPHVELGRDILTFFTSCGGKLYVYEGGCAAAETYDGTTYFREILGGVSEQRLASLSEEEKCCIHAPGDDIATGMIYGCSSIKNGWIGLTLE